MNKDVIYIEPEDDITDVISRIKTSKQKIVALVPPKKVGIMRSAVNVKLIAKTAKMKDKAAVIVTTDPSLIKLSAMAGIPISKSLNSRPILPSELINHKKSESENDDKEKPEADYDMEGDGSDNKSDNPDESAKKSDKEMSLNSDEVENSDVEKSKKKDKKVELIPNFDRYRKWFIIGGATIFTLTVVLIWAFVIAPFAKITVKLKTVSSNVAEDVTLVTDAKKVDNVNGKFLLEQIKFEEESSIEFEATGKANKGEKAKGTVRGYGVFSLDEEGKTVNLPAGSTVTIHGKDFTTNAAASASWDGVSAHCDNRGNNMCYKSFTVDVTAKEAGTAYNVSSATNNDGKINANSFTFASSAAMTGGTDKEVTVVSESNINDAKDILLSELSEEEGKEKLNAQIEKEVVQINSSYKTEIKDPVSSPKKDGEVEKGKKAKLTVKIVYTVYVVDRNSVDEYINNIEASQLGEHDKIYTTGKPFFERFLEGNDGTYTARLKTTVKFGPEISEELIIKAAKGHKIGEAQALIKDISSNISEAKIETSFPWVRSVPDDEKKISIKIAEE